MTLPTGTRLFAVVIAPTTRPAPVIAELAAACVRLTTFGTEAVAGPLEMTSATALPGATLAPALGFWLMTLPAGTVALLAFVIAPTTRPAPVMDAVAAACVRLTTLGTVTFAGPLEINSATALPAGTPVPAIGDWLITLPAGTVALLPVVIVPTTRPAPVI